MKDGGMGLGRSASKTVPFWLRSSALLKTGLKVPFGHPTFRTSFLDMEVLHEPSFRLLARFHR